MPYIIKDSREDLDNIISKFPEIPTLSDGELTYIIYKLLLDHIKYNKSYSTLSSCMGILECVKSEFYRRVISPYEDKKIEENGDVIW